MLSKALWKYIRISPRKLRLIADEIRGMKVEKALAVLPNVNHKGGPIFHKILKSAVANAVNREDISVREEELFISKLMVDEAPRMKRFRAASRGRALPYVHRYSHIVVELDKIETKKTQTSAAK